MPSSSQVPRDSPARRQRRRRTHHRTDSNGELLRNQDPDNTAPSSPRAAGSRPNRYKHRDGGGGGGRSSRTAPNSEYTTTTTTALSAAQLAELDKLNRKLGWSEYDGIQRARANVEEEEEEEEEDDDDQTRAEYDNDRKRERDERERERERRRQEHRERKRRQRQEERAMGTREDDFVNERPRDYDRREKPKRRVASGQALERGSRSHYNEKEEFREDVRRRRTSRGGGNEYELTEDERRKKKRRRNIIIGVVVAIVVLIIIIVAAVVATKKTSTSDPVSGEAPGSSKPNNGNLKGISPSSIPTWAQGTYLDPFDWYDTLDFNLTFTNATVGGLSVMGLNSSWDDSTQASPNVPALSTAWQYGSMPIRGVNLGGWLSIEPFITPSLFSGFSTHDNVVDEWTLSQTLGPTNAKSTIEQHYSSFVQESTFADIQAAGFDHVRIPFSYWAITTYDDDPYVPLVSWRYLLRGIEWARKYGLRINLDLHGAPGSQNGWNHSGRQGVINWLNGTDGELNGQRTIDLHQQLITFFTQPRYQNIVTMYGLVNEPRMIVLDTDTVMAWSQKAIDAIRTNNFTGIIVISDGFLALNDWQGQLSQNKDLLLDAHQYVIFNVQQIVLDHTDKINFACSGWTGQTVQSQNPNTGFGPTLTGEWSQADTDCAQYLNNVGVGSRWEGTLNMAATPGSVNETSVLEPTCPTHNNPQCSCTNANADPSSYSDVYKQWLLMFAQAQMYSFEMGWGWFYWTWQTEAATQWSYSAGLAAGIMPKLAYQRDFNCSTGSIPDFAAQGLDEYY